MKTTRKKDKLKLIQKVLWRLVSDAERISNKYGHDDDGKPSDYSEWVDLRNTIAKAKEKL
jgi:hypothetical protein